ncbi:hypothetical protein C8N46_10546 [Kordia periserrulae]|uniref:Uncharacterized protein n=2 Tax=Kordia periserrulae TaxID=701523 RepID=A0A2T6BXU7_9FLAO|nr:hypothetical protein C8N46_10546 [Kordia periserrulae]
MKIVHKCWIPFAILMILLNSCTRVLTEWEKYGLKGNVKSMKEEDFEVIEESENWDIGPKMEYGYVINFDKEGYYENLVYHDSKGNFIEKYIPKRKGRKIYEELRYDENNEITRKILVTYSSNKKRKYKILKADGELLSKNISYVENKLVSRREIYVYDESFENDQLKFISEFTYDDNQNLIKYLQFTGKEETASYTYKYLEFDDQGNWTKRLEYNTQNDSSTPDKITIRTYEYY